MSRKKKTSTAEDILELVALLPWWGGVALALVSYLVLHALAAPDPIQAPQPGQMAGFAIRALWKGLANAGQYVVPLLCLFGAAASALRRRHRSQLASQVARSDAAGALDGMSWREFELLVGEAFRLQGYKVLELGGSGPDGGVDLVLMRGKEKFLVQCKQWKAFKVGVAVVRELYGAMAANGAAGGFVVTSGRFTEDAVAFANGRNVRLVDGPKLLGLLQQARSAQAATPRQEAATPRAAPPMDATPACPSCGAAMVRRTAKRGANVGAAFWGCASYPACKGVRSIA
ncbi:restriction endonuclease [Polaromonas sp.]|uniref:restriction endonuclease n=1 Tax=Polaromonas sp. TaxID=1869339 RepID=UPI002FC7AFE9